MTSAPLPFFINSCKIYSVFSLIVFFNFVVLLYICKILTQLFFSFHVQYCVHDVKNTTILDFSSILQHRIWFINFRNWNNKDQHWHIQTNATLFSLWYRKLQFGLYSLTFFLFGPFFFKFHGLVLNFICFTFHSLNFERKEIDIEK
jgi:hypothetical protein